MLRFALHCTTLNAAQGIISVTGNIIEVLCMLFCSESARGLMKYCAVGRITSLIGKGDRVLAQRVEDALARGLPLDQLSANKNVLPPHMRCGSD